MKDFYDNLDLLLVEKNLSRRQLAERIQIPPTTLQNSFWRKSKSISIETVAKIAAELNVTIEELIKSPINEDDPAKDFNIDIRSSLLQNFGILNAKGKMEAVKAVVDLACQPKYQSDEFKKKYNL